jgi:hypothetical protein
MVHYNGLASSHTGAEAEILTLGTKEDRRKKEKKEDKPLFSPTGKGKAKLPPIAIANAMKICFKSMIISSDFLPLNESSYM